LLASGIMVWFFRPTFSDDQGPGLFTGLAFHVITLTAKLGWWMPPIAMIIASFAGILVFMALFKTRLSDWDKLATLSIFLLAIGYASNTQIGERHLLGLLILLLLLILPRLKKPFILWQLAWMAFIGIGYFFYWNFLKFN
jgi:hypothetical protein